MNIVKDNSIIEIIAYKITLFKRFLTAGNEL
jgi:hypothetical protein